MNAIVDMIMEGIICKDCGEFIDGESPGYERSCGCVVEEEPDVRKSNSFTDIISSMIKNS